MIIRQKFHRILFSAAGIYNILWDPWVRVDPQQLFRLAKIELPDYPEKAVVSEWLSGLTELFILKLPEIRNVVSYLFWSVWSAKV